MCSCAGHSCARPTRGRAQHSLIPCVLVHRHAQTTLRQAACTLQSQCHFRQAWLDTGRERTHRAPVPQGQSLPASVPSTPVCRRCCLHLCSLNHQTHMLCCRALCRQEQRYTPTIAPTRASWIAVHLAPSPARTSHIISVPTYSYDDATPTVPSDCLITPPATNYSSPNTVTPNALGSASFAASLTSCACR